MWQWRSKLLAILSHAPLAAKWRGKKGKSWTYPSCRVLLLVTLRRMYFENKIKLGGLFYLHFEKVAGKTPQLTSKKYKKLSSWYIVSKHFADYVCLCTHTLKIWGVKYRSAIWNKVRSQSSVLKTDGHFTHSTNTTLVTWWNSCNGAGLLAYISILDNTHDSYSGEPRSKSNSHIKPKFKQLTD